MTRRLIQLHYTYRWEGTRRPSLTTRESTLSATSQHLFDAYKTAKQHISQRKHTVADEALVSAWDAGRKLIIENKRLTLLAEERKTTMDTALERIRMLVARNDILESRGTGKVTLEQMMFSEKSQAGEK